MSQRRSSTTPCCRWPRTRNNTAIPPATTPASPTTCGLKVGRISAFTTTTHQPPITKRPPAISSLLNAAGVSWKAYQEDISGTACPLTDQGSYVVKHDPFVFFDDVTVSNNPP